MENIEYFLEQHQKQLELDRTRLGIKNVVQHDFTPDKTCTEELNIELVAKEDDEGDPFKIYDELITNKTNEVNKMMSEETLTSQTNSQPSTSRSLNSSNDMDQWVTDAFYSYFPSFNKVEVEKRSKSRAQLRQEYNDFLNRKSKQPENQKLTSHRNTINVNDDVKLSIPTSVVNYDGQSEKFIARENSPRYKHLKDLQHTDLSNILNSDTVDERNKLAFEEENRKKMEYQRDLVKQIEDKRVEIERLKQKEKYEEDLLTKRLEEQLKTLELEEELEKEKVFSEKTRLANEQNHILRMHILSKLDNDHKIYNPYDERKTQSENGKDKFVERDETLGNVSRSSDDNKIYKYFSNSARNEKFVLPEINNNNNNQIRSQYCKSCQDLMPVEWVTFYGDKLAVCPKCVKVCPFCNHHRDEKPSKINHNDIDNNHLRNKMGRRKEQIRVPTTKLYEPQQEDNEDDDDDDYTVDLNPIYVKSRNKKPFSLNLEKDSIFNPTHRIPESKVAVNIKHGEIFVDNIIEKPIKFSHNLEKLKEKTDEKLDKYYKNYDDIRRRRSLIGNSSKMPKIPNAFQVLDEPSPPPPPPSIHHKTNNNTRNDDIRVLTKLGAIRKQLQLEQLEMDNQHK